MPLRPFPLLLSIFRFPLSAFRLSPSSLLSPFRLPTSDFRLSPFYFLLSTFSLLLLPSISSASTESDIKLRPILQKYQEAMGGSAALEKLESIRFAADSVDHKGESTRLFVIKKKPNLVRITIESGQFRIIQAYNGTTAWESISGPGINRASQMKTEPAAAFIREAPIGSILLINNAETHSLSYEGEALFSNRPCHRIRVSFPAGNHTIYYIDKQDYVERQILEFDGINPEPLSTLIPSDYRKINGVLIAFRTIRKVNDITVNTTTLETVDVNYGVLNKVFDPPAKLTELLEK